MSSISENLERVQAQIASAAEQTGRPVDGIELVAVSKTRNHLLGERRVQEARIKIPELSSSLRWHFIGHLQKNKIRHALPLFELFHGIDSLDLARDMNRIAEEEGSRPKVLLEVNVAGEGSKFGFQA